LQGGGISVKRYWYKRLWKNPVSGNRSGGVEEKRGQFYQPQTIEGSKEAVKREKDRPVQTGEGGRCSNMHPRRERNAYAPMARSRCGGEEAPLDHRLRPGGRLRRREKSNKLPPLWRGYIREHRRGKKKIVLTNTRPTRREENGGRTNRPD